jgi:hypothetical protein
MLRCGRNASSGCSIDRIAVRLLVTRTRPRGVSSFKIRERRCWRDRMRVLPLSDIVMLELMEVR